MFRLLALAVLAFLAGAAATFVLVKPDATAQRSAQAGSPVIENVPTVSLAEAESHRDNRYRSMHTIEDTLALPGDFAQTEALYALAGRSDSAGVQNLIFQANGIADRLDRKAALDILFSRLTELDPRSALALSRTGEFRAERYLEAGVWQSWGQLDLDAALAGAAALDSPFERNLAAQALYAAYGYQGNDATDLIEQALDIPPNSQTRAAWLFHLAERDPAEAVAAVNALSDPMQQHEYANYLGRHLGRLNGLAAARHADLFRGQGMRQVYRRAVAAAAAEADPEAILDELLAGRPGMERTMESHRALQTLASRDVEKALAYLARIGNPQHRAMLANAIAPALAQADPDRAILWAKENDRGMHNGLLSGVLAAIASTEPEKAIDEAQQLPSAQQRQQALGSIAMTMSQHEPQRAVELLDHIERTGDRMTVARNIAMFWVQSDPDAALSWMLQRDGNERETMLSMGAEMLVQSDLDSAIRWLPRLDEKSQAVWRAQIASNLAAQRSPAEALQFISRYEGSVEYPQLLASVVNGIAQTDMQTALQMAERVPEGLQRDGLYTGLIGRYGRQDPEQAARILDSIADEGQRARATSMLVMSWSHNDPAGAQQWAERLPRGDRRDDAVVQLASNWDELTPSRRLLLNSIGNLEKRRQALMMAVRGIARTDPQQAETLMRELDFTDDERRELQHGISVMRAYQ
jgi:hypothetical protein